MLSNREQEITTLRNDLLRSIAVCDERIRISKQNESTYTQLKEYDAHTDKMLSGMRDTANHMNKMYKNIKFFLENKKSESKAILEASIRRTSEIIKDSDLTKCTIMHNNGKTYILNERGQSINDREGSAARATMGFTLRYTCMRAMPNMIQIMFMDEALATLSSMSTVTLRDNIAWMSESIGIVGIEQKDILYNGIATKRYRATKTGKESHIREEGV